MDYIVHNTVPQNTIPLTPQKINSRNRPIIPPSNFLVPKDSMEYRTYHGFQKRYVSIEGNIGVGKSTLCSSLAKNQKKYLVAMEPHIENPFLEDFYKGDKKVIPAMQMWICMERRRRIDDLFRRTSPPSVIAVSDRTNFSDQCFLDVLHDNGDINDFQLDYLWEIENDVIETVNLPGLVIYLDASPETCMKRIKKRDVEYEVDGITIDYLRQLDVKFKKYMTRLSEHIKVIFIDTEGKTDKIVREEVEKNIDTYYAGLLFVLKLKILNQLTKVYKKDEIETGLTPEEKESLYEHYEIYYKFISNNTNLFCDEKIEWILNKCD